jgi:hypothetical protein
MVQSTINCPLSSGKCSIQLNEWREENGPPNVAHDTLDHIESFLVDKQKNNKKNRELQDSISMVVQNKWKPTEQLMSCIAELQWITKRRIFEHSENVASAFD